jgi:superfamily I DNA/RNA helicase
MESLQQANIPVYWLSENARSKIEYDPEMNKVILSTPDSGKGLEWEIVFLPSLNHYTREHADALRFVAAMRARNILYPSNVD